jgi:4,5-DOPA dioxygenase extradiol
MIAQARRISRAPSRHPDRRADPPEHSMTDPNLTIVPASADDGRPSPSRLPALYLGHGAPPLLEDESWPGQLVAWSAGLPRPSSILVVSAHWQTAPMALGATTRVPLVYDFYGFPQHYYELTYDAPGAPELAAKVKGLMPATEPVIDRPARGLDHGAWVPLLAMYPKHDIPVLQVSMPDLDPEHLFEVGRRLAPLRDEGVLIIGSGFMTHGLPFIHDYFMGKPGAPAWSIEFDRWAAEALERGDLDALFDFRDRAPGMPYAHPTVEHFAPLFVTLGAAATADDAPTFTIDGYWLGLAKRSFEVR